MRIVRCAESCDSRGEWGERHTFSKVLFFLHVTVGYLTSYELMNDNCD